MEKKSYMLTIRNLLKLAGAKVSTAENTLMFSDKSLNIVLETLKKLKFESCYGNNELFFNEKGVEILVHRYFGEPKSEIQIKRYVLFVIFVPKSDAV